MRNKRIPSCALVIGLLLVGCSAQGTKSLSAESKMPELRPVIVRGAMDLEVKKFASRLDNVSVERVGGWTFWRGTLDGYPVIVSKTLKGVSNSAAATAIAAERYHPVAIVNQGTAGGHDQQLHVYDIVLGKYSVNLGAFKTAYRKRGQGSDLLRGSPASLQVIPCRKPEPPRIAPSSLTTRSPRRTRPRRSRITSCGAGRKPRQNTSEPSASTRITRRRINGLLIISE